jgi:acylphosphatase
MPEKSCIHCIIAGHVQGVWFRASTQDKAKELGLTGWVRNLPDGKVEVLACGDKDKLEELHQWLHIGPQLAKVTDVVYEECEWQEYDRFGVK